MLRVGTHSYVIVRKGGDAPERSVRVAFGSEPLAEAFWAAAVAANGVQCVTGLLGAGPGPGFLSEKHLLKTLRKEVASGAIKVFQLNTLQKVSGGAGATPPSKLVPIEAPQTLVPSITNPRWAPVTDDWNKKVGKVVSWDGAKHDPVSFADTLGVARYGDTIELQADVRNLSAATFIVFNGEKAIVSLPATFEGIRASAKWVVAPPEVGGNYVLPRHAKLQFKVFGKGAAPAGPTPIKVETDYRRANLALKYMHKEMVTNAQSELVKQIRVLLKIGERYAALGQWLLKVGPGRDWDHKDFLRKLLRLDETPESAFPIPGDSDHEYYYDIWSNIHYGYVGTAAGISAKDLQDGADVPIIAGKNDADDMLSTAIGIFLWNKYGLALTEDQLRVSIVAMRPSYLKNKDQHVVYGNSKKQRSSGPKGFMR